VYPILLALPEGERLSDEKPEIVIHLEMLMPFIESCGDGHFQRFILSPRIVSGESRLLSELYGSSPHILSDEELNEFRMKLLVDVLPNLNTIFSPTPVNTPTAFPPIIPTPIPQTEAS